MNQTPKQYRRVLATILVPEDSMNPVCPADDLWQLLNEHGCEVARAAYADNDTYTEDGQVIKIGPDEGTWVWAKVGPSQPAAQTPGGHWINAIRSTPVSPAGSLPPT